MGQKACSLLLANVHGDVKVRKEIVPQRLIIRDTSAKIR
jgi:DNA-binding LacI/PurR family transcriptional regulator